MKLLKLALFLILCVSSFGQSYTYTCYLVNDSGTNISMTSYRIIANGTQRAQTSVPATFTNGATHNLNWGPVSGASGMTLKYQYDPNGAQGITDALNDSGNTSGYTLPAADVTFYFYIAGTPIPCVSNVCIVNPYSDRAVNAYWKIIRDGDLISEHNEVIQPSGGLIMVGTTNIVGGKACYEFVYDCELDTLQWGYRYDAPFLVYDPETGTWDSLSGVGDFVVSDNPTQGGTNPPPLLPPNDGLNHNVYGTNGPIAWNGLTNLDGILRSGFNLLGNQGNDAYRQRQQMIAELQKIRDKIGATTNEGHDATLHGILTNGVAVTNSIYEGYTNLLSNIASATNRYGVLGGDIRSGMNVFSNIAQNFPDGSTAADLGWMNVEIAGFNWNLNPLANSSVAEMFTLAKKMFTWCFYALYVFAVIRRIEAVVKALGTAQQGTVPNVEISALGFGGNVGVLLSAAIIPIFLFVMATVTGWIGTEVSAWLSGDVAAQLTSNPLTGYGTSVMSGLRLAGEFFPFPVVFGLLGGYLIWYAMSIGMISFINFVIRFTFGS